MALGRLRNNSGRQQQQWPPVQRPASNADRERLLQEAREASRISDEIDKSIARERAERLKSEPQLKILLLGQAESGKSTTLKAFKLQYAPRQFAAEVDLWTAVVLHNLVFSINIILDALREYEQDISSRPNEPNQIPMTVELRTLRLRLGPLSACETSIRKRISPSGSIQPASPRNQQISRRSSQPELAVRALGGFDVTLGTANQQPGIPTAAIEQEFQSSRRVIQACAPDMKLLWHDPSVRAILQRYRIDLSERSGYFLEDLDRIADRSYRPTAEDVLRARLKTLGATEHRINVEQGHDQGKQWLMIDVGGSRRQRYTWVPFFDNVQSIIFLAPVSTFNEELEEERGVNRLEDSVLLWTDICSNKLLAHVHLILFMNKVDILEQKLRKGIRFNKWVETYKGENESSAVIKYLQLKFTHIHHQCSHTQRPLGIFKTSVIDHRTTPRILSQVRSAIVKSMLEKTGML